MVRDALALIKQNRNDGTHMKRINSVDWLEKMLQGMIKFSELLGIQQEDIQHFKAKFEMELNQLQSEEYRHFY